MATSSEIQRAMALKKNSPNMSISDAVSSIRKEATGAVQGFVQKAQDKLGGTVSATATPAVATIGGPAPVAPVIPPTAPASTPETIPAAPVPTQGMVVPSIFKETAAPIAPTKAPEAPKPEPTFMTEVQREAKLGQVDQQASRDQMLANVGIMTKEDPNMATDRAKFDAKTGYVGKSPEEKVILDQYFQANVPKTAGDIRKQLQTGVAITDKNILNTTAYRQAKFEQDRFSKYNSMNSEQLFSELRAGNIPSSIQNELAANPNFSAAKQKEAQSTQIDNTNASLKAFMGTATPTVDPLTRLSETLTALYSGQGQTGSTAEAFKAYISQNPEITQPTAEYNQKYGQKQELERAREQLVTDLKKKFAGEPLSTIMVMAANQSEPLNRQINTLNDSLNLLAADIKNKTDFATQEFGFYQQDQQAQQAKQQKLQEVLGGLAISQFGREQDQAFDLQKTANAQQFDLYKTDIQNKYQADVDTQKYIRELQTLGVKNIYDLERMSKDQEFQKEIEAIKNKYATSKSVNDFNNELYKLGIAPPSPTGTTSNGQYSPGMTDFTGLAGKYPNVAAFKNNNPAGITWNANFDNGKGTAKALADAGIYFEKGTSRPASEGGNYVKFNSIEDGVAAQRIMLEKTYGNSTVGSMLSSWVGTKEGPAYAKQVAGMAGLDVSDKVSDLSPEQLDMLQIAKLKKESPGLYNELSNAGIVEGNTINFERPTTTQYQDALTSDTIAGDFARSIQKGEISGMTGKPKAVTAVDTVLFDKFLTGKNTENDTKELARRGFTLDSVNEYAKTIPAATELSPDKFTQYTAIKNDFKGNKEVTAFESAMSSYGDLASSLKSENGAGDVAAIFQFMKTLDPTSTVRETEFELAAKSAGVWEQFKNIPDYKLEGNLLTDEQRKAFRKLALKYVENKANIYNTKYKDMERIFEKQGISKDYLPANMADFSKSFEDKPESFIYKK